MKLSSTRIVVELCGGSISAVYASAPGVACTVIDWDELQLNEPLPVIVSRPLASASKDIKELLPEGFVRATPA